MKKAANINIERLLDLTQDMLRLADEGVRDGEDDGCAILYGVLRDSAYRLRGQAEEERRRHIERGVWE